MIGSLISPGSQILYADEFNELNGFIGKNDGLIVAGPRNKILFEKNSSNNLVPASTLKILTALVALHHMGADYKFPTELYLDTHSNLKVKGYGDPLLLSEVLSDIAATLSEKMKSYNDLILDDSFFYHPAVIPGINSSFQPYDAPNGALCANFNTVYFKRDKTGKFISAESQTPLLPFVIPRIKASTLDRERIILSHQKKEGTFYAGHLLRYFLYEKGIKFTGKIRLGTVRNESDRLIFRHYSNFPLEQVIARLLEFSNNFIANQILIVLGANLYGPPGTLNKGVLAVSNYLKNELPTESVTLVEGSGISRDNRISAKTMLLVLEKFAPYRYLMRKDGQEYYKTGRLSGISTRAGFIEDIDGKLYRFVLFCNTPGKSTKKIMKKIHALIETSTHAALIH